MYDTVKTNGEKTSKIENVTATEQIEKLTLHEKPPFDSSISSLVNPNTLPQSASNAESIDVWYGQNKWWEDIERRKRDGDKTIKTLTRHEKTPFDSSIHILVNPNTLPQSSLNSASIDVWYGENKWLEDIERRKMENRNIGGDLPVSDRKWLLTRRC